MKVKGFILGIVMAVIIASFGGVGHATTSTVCAGTNDFGSITLVPPTSVGTQNWPSDGWIDQETTLYAGTQEVTTAFLDTDNNGECVSGPLAGLHCRGVNCGPLEYQPVLIDDEYQPTVASSYDCTYTVIGEIKNNSTTTPVPTVLFSLYADTLDASGAFDSEVFLSSYSGSIAAGGANFFSLSGTASFSTYDTNDVAQLGVVEGGSPGSGPFGGCDGLCTMWAEIQAICTQL